ncbi:MAG: N-acetylmuramoyl-L-alanine amidase [Alphaproteobacteria bacterium]
MVQPVFMSKLSPIAFPSPNHGPRRAGSRVDIMVLHYTGMTTTEEALQRLSDPEAEVSCHWLIDEDGTLYQLVPEHRRAWHAGRGCWKGERDVNSRSIGIELSNPGHEHGYRSFPEPQIATLKRLMREIMDRHPIAPDGVIGHSDMAPGRKIDPGELFPWQDLAKDGLSIWPNRDLVVQAPDTLPLREIQQRLNGFGYDCPQSGVMDAATKTVLTEFQRRFRPQDITGNPDRGTIKTLHSLTRDLDLTPDAPAP